PERHPHHPALLDLPLGGPGGGRALQAHLRRRHHGLSRYGVFGDGACVAAGGVPAGSPSARRASARAVRQVAMSGSVAGRLFSRAVRLSRKRGSAASGRPRRSSVRPRLTSTPVSLPLSSPFFRNESSAS